MRSIVTLAIVVVLLNGTGRVGNAYWKYYQFKDAAAEKLRFGGLLPTSTLHEQMMDKAGKLEIPIEWDQISASRDGQATVIEAFYVQDVELLPIYRYPISFRFRVHALLEENPPPGAR
jgi:hypothetical protein